MSNKKITDLTELTTPTTDDVFPIVDIATNTTQKVQVGNLPIQTAVTTALATKQATLVSGTNIKTVNSTTLLGSGDIAVQPTLVSGTNIKTLNSVSLLGSGDIVLTANPSGVAGAIQFSNGSAFASDATNLFWDDTNNRLGIGTNAPTQTLDVRNTGTAAIFNVQNNAGGFSFGVDSAGGYGQAGTAGKGVAFYNNAGTSFLAISGSGGTGVNITNPSAALHIKGSGSTSATTSLLVQNSAGVSSLQVTDDGSVYNLGKGAITSNSGFGRLALINNTTGTNNTANGVSALQNNTTGSANTADGVSALASNLTGSNNTAIGRSSLTFMTAGSANTAVGAVALYSTTGSNNTALGYEAGFANTTGANNTLLGQNTVTGNFSGSVIIGKDAIATASNQFVVGSTGTNAGAVTTESNSSTKVWNVIINGVAQKILLA